MSLMHGTYHSKYNLLTGWLSQWNGTGMFIGKDGTNIKNKLFLSSFYLLQSAKLRQYNFLYNTMLFLCSYKFW